MVTNVIKGKVGCVFLKCINELFRNMHNDRPGMHPQQYNKVPQQINKQFNQPPIPQHMAGPQHIGVSNAR